MEEYTCSFCGISSSQAAKVITAAGPHGKINICDNCIKMMYQLISEAEENLQDNVCLKKPSEIKAHLDKYIISQDKAKEQVAVAFYEHQKQVKYNAAIINNKKQEALENGSILIIGSTGSGKALPLDTLILTPQGFIPLRDIHVGSTIYDEDGQTTIVTAEYPQSGLQQNWLVTFVDGTKIYCNAEHLWKFKVGSADWQEDTIQNIATNFNILVDSIAIPINQPIQFWKKDLFIPPYLLGVLISATAEAVASEKVRNKINSIIGDDDLNATDKKLYYSKLKQCINNTFGEYCEKINSIPNEYLLSSVDDRFELLYGIMDANNVKSNEYIYVASEQLLNNLVFLIRSLGYRCIINKNDLAVQIDFSTSNLPIQSIEKLDIYSEMKCLTVDSPKHTYICEDFIVTHNTATFKAIAKYFDRPLLLASIAETTTNGVVGPDVSDIIANAIRNCNGDIERAERSIIFLDEFDKLAKRNHGMVSGKDVGGESVQQILLKYLEGDKVTVQLGSKRNPFADNSVEFDTSNVLFILAGAFEGLDEIIKNRINKKEIGFGKNDKKYTKDDYLNQVTTEDLINYGIISELIGRCSNIVVYNQLTEDNLIEILTKPKNAIVKQYQELFKMDNIKLSFTDDALRLIAKQAIKKKTNARGLRGILAKALADIEYAIPDRNDIQEVIITKDLINNMMLN